MPHPGWRKSKLAIIASRIRRLHTNGIRPVSWVVCHHGAVAEIDEYSYDLGLASCRPSPIGPVDPSEEYGAMVSLNPVPSPKDQGRPSSMVSLFWPV
jgi:hypothetical protein